MGVKLARHKKQGEDGDENQINHTFCLPVAGEASQPAAR